MNYQEFRQRMPKITVPEPGNTLIEGEDSLHWTIRIGSIVGNEYSIHISEETMQDFLDVVELLEERGAKNGQDYIVCGQKRISSITLGIHTTRNFLNVVEDFEKGFLLNDRRIRTSNKSTGRS